jgi:ABC-type transport system substrate-binding protein
VVIISLVFAAVLVVGWIGQIGMHSRRPRESLPLSRIVVALLFAAVTLPFIAFASSDWQLVRRVVDADTLVLRDGERVRLIGIDAARMLAIVGMLITMWYITPPHPDITAYYACGESTNTFFYCNDRVDELLAEARATEDMDTQVELYHEVQQIIAEDAPVVFLYYPYELQALNESIHNWASLGFRDALSHMVDVWKEQ